MDLLTMSMASAMAKKYTDEKLDDIGLQNMAYYFCGSGEYNTSTGVPTVSSPDGNTFYFAPAVSGGLFNVYVYKNSAWVLFTLVELDLSNAPVDNTLSIVGMAADAKKTGDEIRGLKDDLSETNERFDSEIADVKAELKDIYSSAEVNFEVKENYGLDNSGNETANSNLQIVYVNVTDAGQYFIHNVNTRTIVKVFGYDSNNAVVSNSVTHAENPSTNNMIAIPSSGIVKIGVSCWKKGYTYTDSYGNWVCNDDSYVTHVIAKDTNTDFVQKSKYPFVCNIYDSKYVLRGIVDNNGELRINNNNSCNYGMIPVNSGDTITVDVTGTTGSYPAFGNNYAIFYGSDFSIVANYAFGTGVFVAPSTAKYLSIKLFYADISLITITQVTNDVEKIKLDERALPSIPVSDSNAYSIYAKIANDVAELTYKYNGVYDMTVQMQKKGGNQLFDFNNWFLTRNPSRTITDVPNTSTEGNSYQSNSTDFFGPYRVRATSNTDGDKATNNDFTGGNHQYNNTGSGSTATARTANLVFYVDGRQVTTFEGYCNNVKIEWDNFIQGNNTKKSDGTGREILKEHYKVLFDGKTFHVENNITALEELYIYTYYGLQMTQQYANVNYDSFLFLGSKTMKATQKPPVSPNMKYSGDKACRDIVNFNNQSSSTFYKNNREMFMESVGIGDFDYVKSIQSSCRASSGKLYFELIEAFDESDSSIDMSKVLTLQANDVIYFRGWYKFYYQN